jgi:hypothetical protein
MISETSTALSLTNQPLGNANYSASGKMAQKGFFGLQNLGMLGMKRMGMTISHNQAFFKKKTQIASQYFFYLFHPFTFGQFVFDVNSSLTLNLRNPIIKRADEKNRRYFYLETT